MNYLKVNHPLSQAISLESLIGSKSLYLSTLGLFVATIILIGNGFSFSNLFFNLSNLSSADKFLKFFVFSASVSDLCLAEISSLGMFFELSYGWGMPHFFIFGGVLSSVDLNLVGVFDFLRMFYRFSPTSFICFFMNFWNLSSPSYEVCSSVAESVYVSSKF